MPFPYAASAEGVASEADPDTTDSRAYRCTLPGCHRAYRRNEHLLRHSRAHTFQKPYDCPKCHKRYSRQDVLKRHITQQHETPKHRRSSAKQRNQSRRPPRVALSPSTSQNEASVDWQRDMAENQEVQKRPSPHSSVTTLGSRPPESNSSDIPDVALGPPLSVSASNTTFQMVLDSGVPWAELPATTASSLHVEKANAPGDTMSTTQNNPFQLNQATITTNCPDTLIWDELSSLTPPFELGQETPEDDTLRNGILEELDALGVPDFDTRDPFDNLRNHDSPTVDTGHSPSLPTACFPVKGLAAQQCLDLYFERFHPQWPIVHRGTFYRSAAARNLISSMIGAWESGIASWMKIAERWGKFLFNRLSQDLVRLNPLMKPAAHKFSLKPRCTLSQRLSASSSPIRHSC